MSEPFAENGFRLVERRVERKLFPQYFFLPFGYHVMIFEIDDKWVEREE